MARHAPRHACGWSARSHKEECGERGKGGVQSRAMGGAQRRGCRRGGAHLVGMNPLSQSAAFVKLEQNCFEQTNERSWHTQVLSATTP